MKLNHLHVAMTLLLNESWLWNYVVILFMIHSARIWLKYYSWNDLLWYPLNKSCFTCNILVLICLFGLCNQYTHLVVSPLPLKLFQQLHFVSYTYRHQLKVFSILMLNFTIMLNVKLQGNETGKRTLPWQDFRYTVTRNVCIQIVWATFHLQTIHINIKQMYLLIRHWGRWRRNSPLSDQLS